MWLEDVMSLPASEVGFWREYYSIFPMPQDRDDLRVALLAERITNMVVSLMAGKIVKAVNLDTFLPDHLNIREYTPTPEKSLEQQRQDAIAFRERLNSMKLRQ